ncbi:MAG: hypothetical protein U5L45_00315 [Saprospiraceae bacterium]|nr:hypothetical protein [Saprospiraceae bacterium]
MAITPFTTEEKIMRLQNRHNDYVRQERFELAEAVKKALDNLVELSVKKKPESAEQSAEQSTGEVSRDHEQPVKVEADYPDANLGGGRTSVINYLHAKRVDTFKKSEKAHFLNATHYNEFLRLTCSLRDSLKAWLKEQDNKEIRRFEVENKTERIIAHIEQYALPQYKQLIYLRQRKLHNYEYDFNVSETLKSFELK